MWGHSTSRRIIRYTLYCATKHLPPRRGLVRREEERAPTVLAVQLLLLQFARLQVRCLARLVGVAWVGGSRAEVAVRQPKSDLARSPLLAPGRLEKVLAILRIRSKCALSEDQKKSEEALLSSCSLSPFLL